MDLDAYFATKENKKVDLSNDKRYDNVDDKFNFEEYYICVNYIYIIYFKEKLIIEDEFNKI